MTVGDYGRRIVIDLDFDRAVIETERALRAEGIAVLARIDAREHFRRTLGHDFRRYALLHVWSPDLALQAMQRDLDTGAIAPATFAMYELADGETAMTVTEPFSPLLSDLAAQREAPVLVALADEQSERVARVLRRLQQSASRQTRAASTA